MAPLWEDTTFLALLPFMAVSVLAAQWLTFKVLQRTSGDDDS